MKKNLLIIIGLLCLFNLSSTASNRYWVGGSGSWNDPSHWSAVSGGSGGSGIPSFTDNVFFDENSTNNSILILSINGLAQCKDLNFSEDLGTTKLIGASSDHFEIYGSLKLTEFVKNNFHGVISFKGSGNKNIDFKNAMPLADVHFSGDAFSQWNLNSNLFLPFSSKIIIEGGQLNASGRLLQGFGIQWIGTTIKSLDISNSTMVLAQLIDESGTGNSAVIKNNSNIYPRSSGGSRTIDSVQTVVIQPNCNASCDGSITVTAYPTSGTYQYDWSGPCPGGCPSGNPLTNLCAGSYLLTVTDLSDGEQTQLFVQVIAPNPIGSNFIRRKPKCFGQCNGSIVATVVIGSGTAPYSYLWTSSVPGFIPQATSTATNLCSGTYTLTVTDDHSCSQTFTQVLTQPAVVVPVATSTDLTCFQVCNGTATSSPTGGNIPTPYSYVWTSAVSGFTTQTTQSIDSLCAGTYSVTVTDDSLCSGSSAVIITEPPLLVISPSSSNISCNGDCDGTASVAPVSGGFGSYSYAWTPAGPTGPSLTNLCPGTYSVIVSDGNLCTQTASFNITQPAPFTVTATGIDVTCFNACDGSISATIAGGTGPYTYSWSPGPAAVTSALLTNTLSSQCAGTYIINVTDANNCTATDTIIIIQPALLVANPTSTNVLCFGNSNGTATANPAGGTAPYTYDWTGTPSGDGTDSIFNLNVGNYCVTVVDSNGCDTTQCVTITQPTVLTVTIIKTNVSCNPGCDGTATAVVSGGTSGYTYLWTGSTLGPYPGQGTDSLTGLCVGTYTVTVTDANGCTKTATTTITQPNVLNATLAFTPILCNGDCTSIITSTVSGGTPPYSFSWSPGTAADTNSSITGQCAGTHTLTVTDANVCVKVVTTTITQPTALTVITSSTNVSCFGLCNGSASVIAGGGTPGYTYFWSPGSFTTSTITNLCIGTYTVTVTDANGCTVTSTVTITSPPQLLANPSIANNVLCSGQCNGSATSAPTGGSGSYTYNWNGPASPSGDGTPTITGLCIGVANLVVTDSLGCTSNQSVTITQPAPLTAPITGSTSSCNVCNGTATVTPTGGTPPYSYSWSDPSNQTTPIASGLCPLVTYTVVVTDSNGCTATTSVTIAQTITITITTSNTTLSCFGACDGIAVANPSGGQVPYTFLWVGAGGPVDFDPIADSLCAGTYSVTVVDSNGCINTDTVTFNNPPVLDVTAVSTDATCGGICNGTATGTATGGTGAYSYSWSTIPVQTTASISGLCAGSYTLTVTDSSGCTDAVTVIINEPAIVIANDSVDDANCLMSDGSILVNPTGGAGPPYTFVWSGPGLLTGQGTNNLINLFPGAYDLVITSGGCSFTFNYLVSNINGPTLVMAHTNVSCNSVCDGTANVTASGGAGGFVYDWSPGTPAGNLTDSISSLCGTVTYTVQVTDAAGCIAFDTATVINPTLISPNPTFTNESCGGLCDGTIILNPTGGSGGYTYQLNNVAATANNTGLCAGAYIVTVTDVNLCDTVFTINITAPPTLSVSLASTNVLCAGGCTGTASATAIGGTGGPYTYLWCHNPTIPLPDVVNLCPGQICVTVGDGSGCTATDTITITEPPILTTVTSQINASCNAMCDGVAIVTPSGGTPGYNFVWSLAGLPNNDTASALCAGIYSVVVTDSNGCTSSPFPLTITQPGAILPTVTATDPTCFGSCNGTAASAATGGTAPYTYDWSGTPAGDGTASVTGLCAGSITLIITDTLGCSNNQTINIIGPAAVFANATSTSPTCNNSCNGSVTATPSGGTPGYTYSWSAGGATSQIVTNLCPNVYTVIVSDTNNCKDTANVTVINPAPINIIVSSTPANCGVCDGTITVNPITGVGPYTYLWSPAPTIGQGTQNADSVCAGLYDVLVTSINGCDSTFTIAMNNSGGADSAIVTTIDATCNLVCNGSGTVTAVGGTPPFIYTWDDGPPATVGNSAVNLCAGNYFVEMKDSNLCIQFAPVTINEPAPILSNDFIVNSICSNVCDGSITLFPSGGTPGPGYTYSWLPLSVTGQGTSAITGLCSGSYTVTITDNNGCTMVDTFDVIQSAPLTVTASSTNIPCSNIIDGTAFVTISTGTAPFTILWNDPLSQTNDTAIGLSAGVYTAIVTDSNTCTQTVSTTISSTPALAGNVTISDATCGICDGTAMSSPSGGTAPYTIFWSNSQTGTNATSLCAGLYTVDITDSSGCVSSFNVPVSSIGGPDSLVITSTNILCNGDVTGAVTGVTPMGGVAPYSFFWIGLGLSTPTLSGLSSGTYFIQVTDSSGCSIVDSVTITESAPILANQTIVPPNCGMADGVITIAPSGGLPPYTILWSTGAVGLSITDTAGVYSVLITDQNGCSQNIVIPMSNINGPVLSVTSTDPTCNAGCNGTATVSVSGGVSPYIYQWNDILNQTTPTATSLCDGNYSIWVKGADGCVSVASLTLTAPPAMGSSISNVIDPLCNGEATGSITVIPSGGTLPYSYVWSPVGGTGATASGLTAISYTVAVSDANGCSITQTFLLTENPPLTISSALTNPSCNSLSDGAIDVTVGGGTSTYSYAWSSGAVTEDLTGLAAGSYTINVTDGNGCTIADTSLLVPNQTVLVSVGNDTTFCQNGSLTLTAISATGITYQWFEMPANTLVGTSATVVVTPITGTSSYYVVTNNGSGCTASDTISVSSNVLPVANAGTDATIIIGTSTVIGGNPTGSTGTTVLWSPIPGLDNATSSNPVATPQTTTVYTVVATTAAGCSASDSVIVTVMPTVIIPDGISPNADGDNDEWMIDGIELFPNCNVEVYNRWGELLFQSAGYKERWKGTFKGKDLPVGTYYYIIDLKDPLFPDVYTGPITILR